MGRAVVILILLLCAAVAKAAVLSCPQTSGTVTLSVAVSRTSGKSPLLVFFDATATTDSSINTTTSSVFQDGHFLWGFGDQDVSGKGNWQYGSHSSYSSKNMATGGLASHLYIRTRYQGDEPVTWTLTYTNPSGTTVTCSGTLTVYDQDGSNGWSAANSTCVFNTSVGSTGPPNGCPTGASTITTSSLSTAMAAFGSHKRYLFKCGDAWTGNSGTIDGTDELIGAYGGCENTTSNRPTFTASTSADVFPFNGNSTNQSDLRFIDLDCRGNSIAANCFNQTGATHISCQVTMYNLNAQDTTQANYAWAQGQQMGLIQSTFPNESNIGAYFNHQGFQPAEWIGCGSNIEEQALIGNLLDGTGAGSSGGIEVFRCSSCIRFVESNNQLQNANNTAPVSKLQASNDPNNGGPYLWVGYYDQYDVLSDNLYRGNSGSELVEVAPENTQYDERIRYVVVERNIFQMDSGTGDHDALMVSGQFVTVRDNETYTPSGLSSANTNSQAYAIGTRPGLTCSAGCTAGTSCCTTANCASGSMCYQTQYVQVLNNGCHYLSNKSGQKCGYTMGSVNFSNLPINTTFENNQLYTAGTSANTIVDNGTSSTVSGNQASPNTNPNVKNYSGNYLGISDFRPTANYTGCNVSVPVIWDAIGIAWGGTWDCGPLHH